MESEDFLLQNCCLKLLVFPGGNELCNKDDHLSLYVTTHEDIFITFALFTTSVFFYFLQRAISELWDVCFENVCFGPRIFRVMLENPRTVRMCVSGRDLILNSSSAISFMLVPRNVRTVPLLPHRYFCISTKSYI